MSVNLYIDTHLFIPRLCNGSTSDSGSDCGGSNPPWGTKLNQEWFSFFLAPSNIGLVHRPLKAERRVRLPWELYNKENPKKDSLIASLFLFRENVEYRFSSWP